ncbi:MAG: peptidoglycan editing factor PgeF [Prochlorothrix sp.]|nr:peptidoglycan editing factor PgeF [Prochlorothrix sp.]
MQTWYWEDWNGLPYLRCSLLDAWPHGFFCQQWWPRNPVDLVEVLDSTATVYRLKQIHSNQVLSTAETHAVQEALGVQMPEHQRPLDEGDGLFTTRPQQSVWVSTADCTPVLVGDAKTGQTAAIHAGWRGTASRIVPRIIERMQAQGSHLSHLRIALGPAIAGEVYQVETGVAVTVGRSLLGAAQANNTGTGSDAEVLQWLQSLPDAPVFGDSQPDRARLDVRRVNLLQLAELGIQREQVSVAPHCTYQEPQNFFSYRRTGEKKVQWSGIVS